MDDFPFLGVAPMIRPRPLPESPRFLAVFVLAAFALAAPAGTASAAGGIGDLYVTSDASDLVRAYNGPTGNYLGIFTPSGAANAQLGIHIAQGKVLVGHITGGVEEYDANTSAYIKTYNPGGSWNWVGVFAPDGNVYIGDFGTNDIRKYDSTTGAYIATMAAIPSPSDMVYGPNGNLYVCSYYFGTVYELDPNTLATVSSWTIPGLPNDVGFLSGGRIIVTAQSSNACHVYDAAHNYLTSFAGTGWANPHGITISPYTGHILIADGVTTQVHEFDPNTYAELNPAFLSPNPGDKIVDLMFRGDESGVPATPTTWGKLKGQYR
jgi:streptogramin lyase